MGKENKKPSGTLEFIICQFLNQGICHPVKLSKEQLTVITNNWPEAKKGIISIILNEKTYLFDVGEMLQDLRKKRGVSFEEEDIKPVYDTMIKRGNLTDVASLSNYVSVKPTCEQLGTLWEKFFDNEWKECELEFLFKELGKPILSQDCFDRLCNGYLEMWAGKKKKAWDHIIQPEEVKAFVSSVGLKPKWDKELAKQVYNKWLAYHLHEKLFLFLQEEVGIKPEEANVQKYYNMRFFKDPSFSLEKEVRFIAEDLKKMVTITGIMPKEDLVKKLYKNYLSEGSVEEIKTIEKLTGIKCDEEIVNFVYSQMLVKGNIGGINLLKNRIKIEPAIGEDDAQVAYENLLKKGEVKAALGVYFLTEVDPKVKGDIIVGACKKIIRDKKVYGDLNEISWLLAHFPEEVVKVLQEYVTDLIEKGNFSTIEAFTSNLKFKLKPEQEYVLACQNGKLGAAKKLYNMHKEVIDVSYPNYANLMKVIPKE